MRLFTAIQLSDQARDAVARLQQRLRRRLDTAALRWVRPEQAHVTLVFIGQVDDTRATAIVDAMRPTLTCCPFELTLGGLGVFPERGAPRILWLGVRAGARETGIVYDQIAARLAALGVPRETRPFHPHVTLARWRDGAGRHARDAAIADAPERVAAMPVDRATLLASTLSSSGSTYTELMQAALECP